MKPVDCRRLLNEGPSAVGLMTSVIGSGGSIDTAVRNVAANGGRLSRTLFTEMVRMVETKASPGIPDALKSKLSELPQSAAGYRRAMLMCLAASETGRNDERFRMLEDASRISLESVREMGESFSASLNTPCMLVFGLGIMAPMILMSILPMLGVNGMFSIPGMDGGIVMLATLVLIPAVILLVAVNLLSSNPFATGPFDLSELRLLLPLALSVPLGVLYTFISEDMSGVFVFSVTPMAVVTLLVMLESHRRDLSDRRCEQGLMDAVLDTGNSMLAGENFENALCSSLTSRKECSSLGKRLERELSLCRGRPDPAVVGCVSPISPDVSAAFVNIDRCSTIDNATAGSLAVTLGRQFQNQHATRTALGIRLKNMTDMMTGTAMFFAPLVLGLSTSMMGSLAGMADVEPIEGAGAITSVYLIELCAIIALMLSSLTGERSIGRILWRFCIMCPVSLVVFLLLSGINL
ncbi:MAG: hypothetical protein IJ856_07505 [Candidatus Methanomethylophilaceae archaeon]|nr:hypothetical protein [Candidatus Methanomethylophilaceae archaeon]